MAEKTYVAIADTNINGDYIKRITDVNNTMTIYMAKEHAQHIVPQAEEPYIEAYMAAHSFFQIGTTHYNPTMQMEAYVETDQAGIETGIVVDADGDIYHHTDPAEIQQLKDGAPIYVWQPPPPA